MLGWEVRHSTPDVVLLAAGSRVGLPAELLLVRRQTLLFATFVQQDSVIARAVWPGVIPVHREVVRNVLAQAGGPDSPREPR